MDEEATGQAQQQANVRVVARMIHFSKGSKDAVKMATLLGIPLSQDWGENTFPGIAWHYGKNAETLALHACYVNLAKEIKMAMTAGIVPEPVGEEVIRSEEKETAFLAALSPLRDYSASALLLGTEVGIAATKSGLMNGGFGHCVRVPVCIDMGWAKRSSGHRYDSRTGSKE